ncbi:MAG: hypothetical protein HZB53_03860 [Chloroflexi bacterium]|nr:hypothetical protein [Chloroflexota bacterium]
MFRTIILSIAAAWLLAACGGGAPSATPASATAPASAPTGTPRPPSVPNVTVVPIVVTPSASTDIVLRRSGGIAGVSDTLTLKADGTVIVEQRTGPKTLHAVDGAVAYTALLGKLEATGIYNVAPGRYWPADPCCDRFAMELTLHRNGQTLVFATVQGTPGVPQPMLDCFQLILQYVASAV